MRTDTLGAEGRRFESCLPDHFIKLLQPLATPAGYFDLGGTGFTAWPFTRVS